MERPTTPTIVDYWDRRVREFGVSGEATLHDANMRALEIETVKQWLRPEDKVLDIFCGNAVTTIELARHCASITGFDLSQGMLEAAAKVIEQRQAQDKVSLKHGNVLELDKIFAPGAFDVVTAIRGLINLPEWDLQKQALQSIHRILPPGGRLIFLEGSKDGLDKINEMRAAHRLPALGEPWYDRHFRGAELDPFMGDLFTLESTRNLDAYFLISRVLYPLAAAPAEPTFDSICNTLARLCVPYLKTDTGTTLLFCRQYVKR